MMTYPKISVIIPSLNSEQTIGECLKSILGQDYPEDKIEIIIADGGSVDNTLEILRNLTAPNMRIIPNKLKTGEAGKAVGAKAAGGEIAAFIDSDNILPAADWLRKMVEPFLDKEIIASEPLEYTYRKTDGYVTRYSALLGMNDPLCLFLGNYDRFCLITGKWTGVPHRQEDRGGYLKVEFCGMNIPTVGANGFLIRRDVLNDYGIGDYLFDVDVIYGIAASTGSVKIAKVKTGIIHIFAGGFLKFLRKQKRRITDYAYYQRRGLRKYGWANKNILGMIKFIVYTALLLPILIQALIGYGKKRDSAWFFHIPACVSSLFIYSSSAILNMFISKPFSRNNW